MCRNDEPKEAFLLRCNCRDDCPISRSIHYLPGCNQHWHSFWTCNEWERSTLEIKTGWLVDEKYTALKTPRWMQFIRRGKVSDKIKFLCLIFKYMYEEKKGWWPRLFLKKRAFLSSSRDSNFFLTLGCILCFFVKNI